MSLPYDRIYQAHIDLVFLEVDGDIGFALEGSRTELDQVYFC